jgi:hypothetical protein
MSKETGQKPLRSQAAIREERLKAALKANMARRKAQSRARTAPAQADNRPQGPHEESS